MKVILREQLTCIINKSLPSSDQVRHILIGLLWAVLLSPYLMDLIIYRVSIVEQPNHLFFYNTYWFLILLAYTWFTW